MTRARAAPDSTDLLALLRVLAGIRVYEHNHSPRLEIFMSIHDEHDNDDHGGLHRDLRSTGAAMDRRGL